MAETKLNQGDIAKLRECYDQEANDGLPTTRSCYSSLLDIAELYFELEGKYEILKSNYTVLQLGVDALRVRADTAEAEATKWQGKAADRLEQVLANARFDSTRPIR